MEHGEALKSSNAIYHSKERWWNRELAETEDLNSLGRLLHVAERTPYELKINETIGRGRIKLCLTSCSLPNPDHASKPSSEKLGMVMGRGRRRQAQLDQIKTAQLVGKDNQSKESGKEVSCRIDMISLVILKIHR